MNLSSFGNRNSTTLKIKKSPRLRRSFIIN
nr:MAG TPA: hypothetical protein [Caudoviricetes sp.]DAX96155.1 MAG TPA: hypothetical protein [Bacteriophage sp.]